MYENGPFNHCEYLDTDRIKYFESFCKKNIFFVQHFDKKKSTDYWTKNDLIYDR